MLIHTTARHCELDPEVRLYALQRLEKLGKFARDIHEAHLVITAERYRHSAEITLRLNHHELVSREESTEARVAIDMAADHVEQQLRRIKGRRVDRKRIPHGGSDRGLAEPGASEPAGTDGPAGEE
jgi:putative sigma-54 modulation protein